MKIKLITFLLTVFTGPVALAQLESSKQVFQAPNLSEFIKKHKTVAILPFEAKITYKKQPKDFNADAHREFEKTMGGNIQLSMYTFLLRRSGDYSVTFQDPERTSILLKKAGMWNKLDELTREEVAKVLGVDAVLGGRFETEQTKSEAGAIASAVLLGGLGGKTGTGTLFLILNDGKSGELLWRFFKTMDANIMQATDDLVERMMRKVSRNFPYMK